MFVLNCVFFVGGSVNNVKSNSGVTPVTPVTPVTSVTPVLEISEEAPTLKPRTFQTATIQNVNFSDHSNESDYSKEE